MPTYRSLARGRCGAELSTRNVGRDTNALASSIVLACRPRPESAPITTRKDFLVSLKKELPQALRNLQKGNIAPVDPGSGGHWPRHGGFLPVQESTRN